MGGIGHAISKGFKKITHGVEKTVKGVVGIATGGALYNNKNLKVETPTTSSNANIVAAPAVAAPEPVVGAEDETLTGRRVKRNNKGKSALYVNAGGGYTGSGGTTGTGLNL